MLPLCLIQHPGLRSQDEFENSLFQKLEDHNVGAHKILQRVINSYCRIIQVNISQMTVWRDTVATGQRLISKVDSKVADLNVFLRATRGQKRRPPAEMAGDPVRVHHTG
ncbi:hypothetical protein CB1_000204011 [Camelus ferus]|nr:hypothetical protein CB1_000204011 [Camelus ferus]